eukprot:SAG31_NODE_20495_length_572_cov_21.188161_2_plen_98_part_01
MRRQAILRVQGIPITVLNLDSRYDRASERPPAVISGVQLAGLVEGPRSQYRVLQSAAQQLTACRRPRVAARGSAAAPDGRRAPPPRARRAVGQPQQPA